MGVAFVVADALAVVVTAVVTAVAAVAETHIYIL